MLTSSLSRNIATLEAGVLCLLAPQPLDVNKGGNFFYNFVEKVGFCSKLLEIVVNLFEWTSFVLNSLREIRGFGWGLGYPGLGFFRCEGTHQQKRSWFNGIFSREREGELEIAAGKLISFINGSFSSLALIAACSG